MTFKERRRLFWILTLFFAVLTPPVIWYATGWRITNGFIFKRTGGLFISAPKSEVEIFVNGELQKRTNLLQTGLFLQGITPGKISIIAAKEDYWPWAKELEIKESAVTETRIFLVPREPEGGVLIHGNYQMIYGLPEEQLLVLEKFKNGNRQPDFYNPAEKVFVTDVQFDSKSGSAALWEIYDSRIKVRVHVSDDRHEISAEWLEEEPLPYFLPALGAISIFKSKSEIRGISFFPQRRDVILVAVENGVFAMELDGRGTRNFQPVYKGKSPVFAVLKNLIYILDDGRLYVVRL